MVDDGLVTFAITDPLYNPKRSITGVFSSLSFEQLSKWNADRKMSMNCDRLLIVVVYCFDGFCLPINKLNYEIIYSDSFLYLN